MWSPQHPFQRLTRGNRWSTRKRLLASLLALVCALLWVAPAPAWAAADTDGGPGVWGPAAPGGARPGSQAHVYEGQINGRGPQFNYWVPYPETRQRPGFNIETWQPWNEPVGQPRSGVAFDGWNRTERVLVDAKGPRYAYLLDPKNARWSSAAVGLEQEAARQLRAASGTPIRWHFAEAGAEQRMAQRLTGLGIESRTTPLRAPATFTAPGSPADPDGLARPRGPAARPPAGAPGGIDFSTLQLRHLSTGSVGPDAVAYSFNTPSTELGESDLNAARDASNAFFVWLELEPSQFWVNLNPGQPDLIIDPDLARTDVGRVMLEADLQLKRTMTPLTGPGTAIGDEFVRRIIQDGPDDDFCTSFRTWITPAPATVRDTGTELYILDAPLDVMIETLYFEDPTTGTRSCPGQTEERAEYNESVLREVVLPEIVRAVNEDPEYADLRRVYLSRVAAEWYRQISATRETWYQPLINDGIVGPWVSAQPWDPMDVFDEYIGLVNASEGSIDVGGITYNWVFGGVDMAEAPADPMSAAQFAEQHPRLPAVVEGSIEQPVKDPDGRTTWAGGATVIEPEQPAAPQPQPPGLAATGTSKWIWLTGLLLLVGGILLLLLARRSRRQPAS